MGVSSMKLIDSDGDALDDGDGKLNVNATLVSTPTIDIGDVSLLLGGTAASTNAGAVGAQTLRVTIAQDDLATARLGTIDIDTGNISTNTSTIAGDTTEIAGLFYTPGTSWAANRGLMSMVLRNDALEAIFAVQDGDLTNLQVNSIGGLYVTGSEVENAAVQSEPLLIGGRYDSSARTLGSGDAGAVALNASGHMLVDVVDGGQLDTIVDTLETTLTAIETDQAAIETLLGTIDADTGNTSGYLSNIQGAVYVDDADWADGSNKHVLVGGLYQSSMQSVTDGDVAPFQIDSNGVLRTSHSIAGGADGVTTVTSAGTDVVLGGDVACKKIDIQAQTDNTGLIAVGFTGVDATVATGTGVILNAGDVYSLEINNLNLIYIDATLDGEGVRYTYFT